MLHQGWLVADQVRLLSVRHMPHGQMPVGTAVLLAGFAHSMCDADYFMSKLARRLVTAGIFVAQVDLTGHGDSWGELSDVDLDILRGDVQVIAGHFIKQAPDLLIMIGRGLTSTLLVEQFSGNSRVAVGAVAPYALAPHEVPAAFASMGDAAVDAVEMFPGVDYVIESDLRTTASGKTLQALGAVPYNLHGERISSRLARQLSSYDAQSLLTAAKRDRTVHVVEEFRRDPGWQQQAIQELADWSLQRCLVS